jgi:hypothetical protein
MKLCIVESLSYTDSGPGGMTANQIKREKSLKNVYQFNFSCFTDIHTKIRGRPRAFREIPIKNY